jgi:phosphoglycerol transferase MdoB-like AlkP superfamily enzyme
LIACAFSSGLIFLYISYLKYKRAINTTELVDREHRINPLTFAVLSYALGYVFLTGFNAPAIVRALMLCYVTNSILVLIITRRWKISLHTTSLGNAVMALVYYGGWMMIPAFGLIPIVAAGRVQTQKHDLLQVGAGALLGTVMTGLQFYFFGL